MPKWMLVLCCTPMVLVATEAFQEQGGLLVMEFEHHQATDRQHWSFQTEYTGATGDGYLEWRHGDSSGGRDKRGEAGVLEWVFDITTVGEYRLSMRSWPSDRTEHNDCWATFPDARFYKVKRNEAAGDLSGWIKIYNNNPDEWAWQTTTVDGDQHQVWVSFPTPGRYRYQVSGRSTRFAIDRIALAHESVRHRDATDPTQPESPRDREGGAPVDRVIRLAIETTISLEPLAAIHLDSGALQEIGENGTAFTGLATTARHRFAFVLLHISARRCASPFLLQHWRSPDHTVSFCGPHAARRTPCVR